MTTTGPKCSRPSCKRTLTPDEITAGYLRCARCRATNRASIHRRQASKTRTNCNRLGCTRSLTPTEIKAGYHRCTRCRTAGATNSRRHRKRQTAHGRAAQQLQEYLNSGTPAAEAYKERARRNRNAASLRWSKANRDRRRMTRLVLTAIRKGELARPTHCQDCGKPCKPVPMGITEWNNTIEVAEWQCWKCVWRDKREAERQNAEA